MIETIIIILLIALIVLSVSNAERLVDIKNILIDSYNEPTDYSKKLEEIKKIVRKL